ncbi:MAG: glycoside hydrolase family 2 TIM barrel-domain containing protein [bacterium]|nr:glycoside hydrolase family 2 TIM barrel-domain containing protein [bacterium]MDY4099398.1 glycoside hydrolase family 2 TIM barrel-domain containing protein [Lachnospiraceae bacterium]
MRERIYLNNGWKFSESFEEGMCRDAYDEEGMIDVRIPHTCKELPLHYFDESLYQMVSGYRKVFTAPADWKGKHVVLTFEGVAHDSEVFLNGEKVAEHHCGYTAFSVDLSEKLRYGGENLLTVRVDSRESLNVPPFGFVIDYMTYGGIYRDIYLEIFDQKHLKDVFVKPQAFPISLASEVIVAGLDEPVRIRQLIRKKSEEAYVLLGEQTLEASNKEEAEQTVRMLFSDRDALQNIELWDVDDPVLYEVKTELCRAGEVLDEQVVTTGFRKAEFKRDGFYLNGRKLRIRGLNRHQSYPYVGYAMPGSAQKTDAEILKRELGVNAVRTSHYPQSHDFIDRCDELGLLVFTEIPGWQHIGNEEWKDQAVQNVKDMVRQYRNHTSIILWGVRINESVDDDVFYKRTNAAAHELDDTRPTGGVRASKKSNLLEDVYTYNDFVHDGLLPGCEKKAKVTSDDSKPYLISEYNGHMFPTKAFDCEGRRTEHALRHANVLDAVAGQGDIAGSFAWCMFDYNTHKDFGSGDRICYHGVMDMFRNPKQAAAVYASQQEDQPVLEISSSMDIGEHPACNWEDLYIFTNADSVRMYKNDQLIREYRQEETSWKQISHGPILIDDFVGDVLETKEHMPKKQADSVKKLLNTVARRGVNHIPKNLYPTILKLLLVYRMTLDQVTDLYTRYVGDWGGASTCYKFEAVKDGKVVKTVVKEPMEQVSLQVVADRTTLTEANCYDVACIRIRAVDEHGNVLPFYNEPVQLSVEGEGELIGPDLIALSGGMGGTYVKTNGKEGKIRLTVRSAQADAVCVDFTVTCKRANNI